MRTYSGDYILGRFAKCTDPNGAIQSINPGDLDEPKINIPFSYEHIAEAVGAAEKSFNTWRRLKTTDRIASIVKYRQLLHQKSKEIAQIISFETGKPVWESLNEIHETLSLIDFFTKLGSQTDIEIENNNGKRGSVVRFFSRGVYAIISPAVQPVLLPHSHFIPALVNGNTVVLKGSRHAPFTAQCIADLMHHSGIPSGVFNMVQGNAEAARRLVSQPGVDGVFFVGSAETGQKIQKQISENYQKSLVLEISAKNAAVIWDDANLDKAVTESLFGFCATAGQRCTSTGRIFVHAKLFDQFLSEIHAMAKKCRIGYGLNEAHSPFMGPLISEETVENYLRYQGIAVREGCEEIMRGKSIEKEKKGYYVSPSIHWATSFDPKSIYQQNEVFGPNVALYKISDLDEIIEILSKTAPGLVGSIYSSQETYLRLMDEMRVGILNWNLPTTEVSYELPYGAPSGNFRPMGSLAAYQCTFPTASLQVGIDHPIELPAEIHPN